MTKTNTGTKTKRARVQIDCSKDGRTHQSFKDECDINALMARQKVTGLVKRHDKTPIYADYSSLGNYDEALNMLNDAQDMVDALPAKLRGEFSNNPGELLEFMSDENNKERAVELGIIQPDPIALVVDDQGEETEEPSED